VVGRVTPNSAAIWATVCLRLPWASQSSYICCASMTWRGPILGFHSTWRRSYLAHVLDPAGIAPRVLRSTRLVELVTSLDVKLVAAAFGLNHDGVIAYLPDQVDAARLANL
jgi:hypothetical protein